MWENEHTPPEKSNVEVVSSGRRHIWVEVRRWRDYPVKRVRMPENILTMDQEFQQARCRDNCVWGQSAEEERPRWGGSNERTEGSRCWNGSWGSQVVASTELRDLGRTESGSVCSPSAKLGSVKGKLRGTKQNMGVWGVWVSNVQGGVRSDQALKSTWPTELSGCITVEWAVTWRA